MTSAPIVQQEEQQFQTALDKFRADATAMAVKTPDECLAAKTMQRDVRTYMKHVHSVLDGFVDDARSALDRARDRVNKWIAPATEVDKILGDKVKAYEVAERQAAEAEQRRINEENARKSREDAERKRREDEAKAKSDREAAIVDIEYRLKNKQIGKREAARLLREAGALEQAAIQEAAAREEEAKKAPPPAVKVQPRIPTVRGVPTSRRPWRWRIVDQAKIPREYWMLDESYISAIVRDKKAETNIAGIEVFQEP